MAAIITKNQRQENLDKITVLERRMSALDPCCLGYRRLQREYDDLMQIELFYQSHDPTEPINTAATTCDPFRTCLVT